MTEYVWSDLREHAVARFGGQTPGGPLEQRVIDVFQKQPALVARAIDKIAGKYAAGTVRNPWPVLAMDVEDGASPSADVRATDSTDREKAIMRAEQWMRAAGMHFPTWPEVEDELFGDRGRLRAWKSDAALRERMEAAWRQSRPSGERDEAGELERGAKFVEDRRRLAEAARAERERLDAAQATAKAEPEPAAVRS